MQTITFELLFFALDPVIVANAKNAGISACLVDWEYRGKTDRQAGADTQINHQTLEELVQTVQISEAPVICRINGFWEGTFEEIDLAISGGAKEIFLPMVRTLEEVESVLEYVNERIDVGILVETLDAVKISPELGRLPLSRVYVGLNDLSIERKSPHIFTPLMDGTLEEIRKHFSVPFGFGGITIVGHGSPVPNQLLLAEMARLECSFSFLRRAFLKDIQGRDLSKEIFLIKEQLQLLENRSQHQIGQDKERLLNVLSSL